MIISITPYYFNTAFLFICNDTARTKVVKNNRRIDRIATLDGGATILDYGFTSSDAELSVTLQKGLNREFGLNLQRLMQTISLVRVSCREGSFVGVIQDLALHSENIQFNLIIKH